MTTQDESAEITAIRVDRFRNRRGDLLSTTSSRGRAWSMVISAMTLVSAILGADVVRLRGEVWRLSLFSWGSVLLSSGFVLAVWICRETGVASLLIPWCWNDRMGGASGQVKMSGRRLAEFSSQK